MRTFQAALIERCDALNQRLSSALPWTYRLARLLVALYDVEPLTRAIYAEMAASGIEGLPEVHGKPVESLGIRGPRDAHKLPKGYGGNFGSRILGFVIRKLGSAEADDFVSWYTTEKVFNNKLKLTKGYSVKQAESFIMDNVAKAILDYRRAKNRHPTRSLVDQEGKIIDLSDPDAYRELDRTIPDGEMHRMLQELARIDPRAPQWLEYRMNERPKGELAKAWGKDPSAVSHFEQRYLREIKKVIEKHLSLS